MHPGLPPRSKLKSSHGGLRDLSTELSSQSNLSDPFSLISKSSSFQMMDITITVDVIDGLVMETKKLNGEPPLGNTPINAVISAMKNVSSSRQIATHVPSLPLSLPSNNFSEKSHNLFVRWPADFDPNGDALSTFKFSRLMKKGPAISGQYSLSHHNYVPENIELSVGLMRGSEILTLGKANVAINGDEFEEMTVDIPICTAKDVVTSKKIRDPSPIRGLADGNSSKNKAIKMLKPLSFARDNKRKFYLNEHAIVRLQVKAAPNVESGEDEYVNPLNYNAKPSITASTTTESSYTSSKNSDDFASISKEDSFHSFASDENHNRYRYGPNSHHVMDHVDGLRNQLGQMRLNHDVRHQSSRRGTRSSTREQRYPSNVRSRSSTRHYDVEDEYPTYERTHYDAPYVNDHRMRSEFRSKSTQRGYRHAEDGRYSNENYDSHRGERHKTRRSHGSTRRHSDDHYKRETTRSRAASKPSKRDPSPMSLVYDILTGSDIDVATSSKTQVRSRSRQLSCEKRKSSEKAKRRPPSSHRTIMV